MYFNGLEKSMVRKSILFEEKRNLLDVLNVYIVRYYCHFYTTNTFFIKNFER